MCEQTVKASSSVLTWVTSPSFLLPDHFLFPADQSQRVTLSMDTLSISLHSYFCFAKDERDEQGWHWGSTSLDPFLCWGICSRSDPKQHARVQTGATPQRVCQHIMDITVHYEDHNDVLISRSQSVTHNKSVISITKQNIR